MRGGTIFCPGAVRPGIVLKDFVQDKFFLFLNLSPKTLNPSNFLLQTKNSRTLPGQKSSLEKSEIYYKRISVFFSSIRTIPGQISPGHSQDGQLQDKKPRRPEGYFGDKESRRQKRLKF